MRDVEPPPSCPDGTSWDGYERMCLRAPIDRTKPIDEELAEKAVAPLGHEHDVGPWTPRWQRTFRTYSAAIFLTLFAAIAVAFAIARSRRRARRLLNVDDA